MDITKKFTNSLLEIYNLEIIKYFIKFLEGEQAVLFALYVGKENQPSKISEKLGITKARMSHIIRSLKEKDMIDTYKNINDRRKMTLVLKTKGEKYIKEKETELMHIFDYFQNKIGNEKIIKLTKMLEEISDIMKGVEI